MLPPDPQLLPIDDNDEVQEDEEEDYEHVEDDEGDGYYNDRIMQYICNSSNFEAWDGSTKLPHQEVDHSEEEDGKYNLQSSRDLSGRDVDHLFMMDYLGGYASD